MPSEDPIFEYVLVVQIDEEFKEKPRVTYRYPPEQKESISGAIMRFCFPEAEATKSSVSKSRREGKGKTKALVKGIGAAETFSFILTEVDGRRRFGYCRRMRVKDGKAHVLECYCILSLRPSFALFRQILDVVEERRKTSSSAVFTFLKTVQSHAFPEYGKPLEVSTFSTGKSEDRAVYTLSRGSATGFVYLDYVSYESLLQCVTPAAVAELYSMLLLERRMIIVARSLALLSSCISAISHLAFPLQWQHVYIPVLPPSLLDYCSAPMPFLVGIQTASLETLQGMPIDEVVVLDLDKGQFLKRFDDPSALPLNHRARLQALLELAIKGRKGKALDAAVAEALHSFQRDLLGSYNKYRNGRTMNDALFVASFDTDLQPFSRELLNSQLWNCFIEDRARAPSRQCPLATIPAGGVPDIRAAATDEDASFVVCVKCGADVPSARARSDKSGRALCANCAGGTSSFLKSLFSADKSGGETKTRSRAGSVSCSPEPAPGSSSPDPSRTRSESSGTVAAGLKKFGSAEGLSTRPGGRSATVSSPNLLSAAQASPKSRSVRNLR